MTAPIFHEIKKPASTIFGPFLIAIVTPLLLSCHGFKHINSSEDQNEGWTLVKIEQSDQPSWHAYSRKLSGTNFIEYKIVGETSLSPDECVSAFNHDILELANGSKPKKFPIYEIIHKSEDSLLTYVIHHEPFPLKNTEMRVRYLYFVDEDGRTAITWKEAWGESLAPPSKKLNRVETFRGSWVFSPTASGSTKAVNIVQFDPKRMPRWLVEPMVIKFLKRGLENISKKSPASSRVRHSSNLLNTKPTAI